MNEHRAFHQAPEGHDTGRIPHGDASMERVQEFLEVACQEVRSLQAQQMGVLMKLINKKALELAQAMHHEEMQELWFTMRSPRVTDAVKEGARKKRQEYVNKARDLIMQTVGVTPEVGDSMKDARAEVDRIINEKGVDRNNKDDVLEAVGVLVRGQGDDGDASYRYPDEIMPQEATERLEKYIVAVLEHQETGKRFRAEEASRDDLVQKDLARRLAHDAVARDFSRILQLNFPDGTPFRTENYHPIITEMLKTYKDGDVAELLGLDRQ